MLLACVEKKKRETKCCVGGKNFTLFFLFGIIIERKLFGGIEKGGKTFYEFTDTSLLFPLLF